MSSQPLPHNPTPPTTPSERTSSRLTQSTQPPRLIGRALARFSAAVPPMIPVVVDRPRRAANTRVGRTDRATTRLNSAARVTRARQTSTVDRAGPPSVVGGHRDVSPAERAHVSHDYSSTSSRQPGAASIGKPPTFSPLPHAGVAYSLGAAISERLHGPRPTQLFGPSHVPGSPTRRPHAGSRLSPSSVVSGPPVRPPTRPPQPGHPPSRPSRLSQLGEIPRQRPTAPTHRGHIPGPSATTIASRYATRPHRAALGSTPDDPSPRTPAVIGRAEPRMVPPHEQSTSATTSTNAVTRPKDRSTARVRPAVVIATGPNTPKTTTNANGRTATRPATAPSGVKATPRATNAETATANRTVNQRPTSKNSSIQRQAVSAASQSERGPRGQRSTIGTAGASPVKTLSPTGVVQRDIDPEAPAGNSLSSAVDIEQIVQAIEDRVMAELDRRGGRYAGRF